MDLLIGATWLAAPGAAAQDGTWDHGQSHLINRRAGRHRMFGQRHHRTTTHTTSCRAVRPDEQRGAISRSRAMLAPGLSPYSAWIGRPR